MTYKDKIYKVEKISYNLYLWNHFHLQILPVEIYQHYDNIMIDSSISLEHVFVIKVKKNNIKMY